MPYIKISVSWPWIVSDQGPHLLDMIQISSFSIRQFSLLVCLVAKIYYLIILVKIYKIKFGQWRGTSKAVAAPLQYNGEVKQI